MANKLLAGPTWTDWVLMTHVKGFVGFWKATIRKRSGTVTELTTPCVIMSNEPQHAESVKATGLELIWDAIKGSI